MENIKMNTRLVVNLREGIIEAEGDESFVRTVYEDFKDRMLKPMVIPSAHKPLLEAAEKTEAIVQEKTTTEPALGKTSKTEGKRPSPASYKPTFNSKLDVSGVEAFYDQYLPANHSEKILIFGVYLRDVVKVYPFSADDIYTCYFTLKHKTEVPEAFWQAFRTMKNRTHHIDYESAEKIEITIAGQNYFGRSLKKKGEAE